MTTFQSHQKPPQSFTRLPTQAAGPGVEGKPRPPTHEQIAQRAYEIYVASGRREGRCEQNWYQAERQLAVSESAPHSARTYPEASSH